MPLPEKRKKPDSQVPFYTNIPGARPLPSGSRAARFSNVGTFNATVQSGVNDRTGAYAPLSSSEATRRGGLTGLTGEQYSALRGSSETKRRRAAESARLTRVGELARQRLIGVQKANAASMEYGRQLTLGEIQHPRDVELAKIEGKGSILDRAFSEAGGTPGTEARGNLEGNQKDYTFAQFAEAPLEEQKKQMAYMKKNDPERYLDFARQFKLLYAPEEETAATTQDIMGQPILRRIPCL